MTQGSDALMLLKNCHTWAILELSSRFVPVADCLLSACRSWAALAGDTGLQVPSLLCNAV